MKPRVLPGIRRILTRENIPILEKFDTVKAFSSLFCRGRREGLEIASFAPISSRLQSIREAAVVSIS